VERAILQRVMLRRVRQHAVDVGLPHVDRAAHRMTSALQAGDRFAALTVALAHRT
jgi:hypothetical protein